MRHISLTLSVIAAVLVGAAITQAQVKNGKTRPLKTAQLMKGVVKANCDAVKKGLENAALNNEQWEDLALHAALLARTVDVKLRRRTTP